MQQMQLSKEKGQSNDLENTTLKTKDWATRTILKTGDELRCSGMVNSSCFPCDTIEKTFDDEKKFLSEHDITALSLRKWLVSYQPLIGWMLCMV